MRMNQQNKTDSAFPQHKVTLVWNPRVSDSIWELQWRPQQRSSSILHCLCCWASLWLVNHPAQLCSFHLALHSAQDCTTQEFLRNLSFYSYVFKNEAFYTHTQILWFDIPTENSIFSPQQQATEGIYKGIRAHSAAFCKDCTYSCLV